MSTFTIKGINKTHAKQLVVKLKAATLEEARRKAEQMGIKVSRVRDAHATPKKLGKPQRSLLGKIIKWCFIGFNVLMAIWLIWGFAVAGQQMQHTHSQAGQAATAIGATIVTMIIVFLWAAGDVILGLAVFFTRPKH